WALGTPNTASTASPTNFSTVPPCSVRVDLATSKNGARRPRSSSGSRSVASRVEPTRSANTIVASFRSAPARWRGGEPQEGQKRASSAAEAPPRAQVGAMGLKIAARSRALWAPSRPEPVDQAAVRRERRLRRVVAAQKAEVGLEARGRAVVVAEA